MDLMDFMDQTLIHEILLSHAAVALVDQDRQGLILLIHFAKLDVTIRQAHLHVLRQTQTCQVAKELVGRAITPTIARPSIFKA